MKRKLFCLIFSIAISLTLFSQKKVDPDDEDVMIAKILKEKYPDDHVAIQDSNDYISFQFDKKSKKVTVNHDLTESLINLDSRVDIQRYGFYDGESEISEFKVHYKNHKNAKFLFEDEAYTNNNLFHNDARVQYVNLDFPVNGYKYFLTFKKEYYDVKYFTKIYFNDNLPIVKKEIKIEVPEWLDMELKEINFDGYNIKKEVSSNTNNNSKLYTYTLENVSAIQNEENAPGPTYIYPHILILAKAYSQNNKKEFIFNSTQDLYNWYKSLVDNLENDNTSFEEKVTELTKDAKTDEEKIKNIYYWVQDNIRYIAFEDGIAGFKPDEASNVYTKKYGDCKGMANLTKQMLVNAGFDARLTWIGTKRIAYDYSTPNLSVDNHMICTLLQDGKTIFLDGTEKFNVFGEYANRIQGKQALIEDGDKFILKVVPTVNSDFNKEIINYTLSLDDENIEGSAHKNYIGESRTRVLYYLNTLKNDKKEESLERFLNNGDRNITISNIKTSNLLNRDISLDISYDISIKNAVSTFDENIYIDLDFDKQLASFDFKKRKTDYIFSSKKKLESITTLKIPSGYKVSKLPENISVSSKNYSLTVSFSQNGSAINYKKIFSLKNAKVETSDFNDWNIFIEELNNIYNEQIILTKQ